MANKPRSGRLWHLAYREASTLAFADAFRAVMLALVLAATLWVRLMRNIAALPRAFEQRALERCAGLNFFIPENANVSG